MAEGEGGSALQAGFALTDATAKSYSVPNSAQSPDSLSSHGMMLDLIGSGKRVVEFGCATGYMSRWLVAAGCRVTGVEVDPAMAAEARGICDEVVVADLDTRRVVDLLPAAAFDVAIFGDVLEHLREPWRVLDEARSVLAPGGSVVMSIPNIAHGNVRLALLHGDFDYQELGLLDNTHLRFFTAKTVRELCLRAGYRIERMDRTKAAMFAPTDTMPKLDPNDFNPLLISEIARDPEHDTFQFIIRAVPLSDHQRLEELIASHSEMLAELKLARTETAKLQEELAVIRERADLQTEQELLLAEQSILIDRERKENEIERNRAVREGESASERVAALERDVHRLEFAMDSERLKAQELDEALRETVALFLNHTDTELEAIRSDISQLDNAIRYVEKSWFWRLKLRLVDVRGAISSRRFKV